jgi:hypothetical protein
VCLIVKPVGEPDAGNPNVRFDERGRETGRPLGEPPRSPSTLLKTKGKDIKSVRHDIDHKRRN